MADQGPAAFSLVQLEPGYRLERYELLAPYARGGMASVWLGRVRGKHGFQRIVAIKTILPDYAADPDFRTMLLDEARIASAVEHANVAQTIDVGEEHGVVYLVLEWVDGDSLYTLHRMLDKTQKQFLPVSVVLRTVADACRGLHAAHELRDRAGTALGVVHRDLSPHNILVNAQGVAKLIDFGVAKAQGRFGGQTSAGIIKGKVRFMSPEQALGREVDRRADIWSVGATLQYLLTGTHPYTGGNEMEVLLAISRADPPAPLPSTVHAAISDVVARALAPDPAQRYPTAASLARAIEVAADTSGNRATTADVAEFLQTAGLPLQERRQRALDLALKAADGRAQYNELLQPIASPGSSKHSGQRQKVDRPPVSEPYVQVHPPASGSVPASIRASGRYPAVPDGPVDGAVDQEDDQSNEKTSPNVAPVGPATGGSRRTMFIALGAVVLAVGGLAIAWPVLSNSNDTRAVVVSPAVPLPTTAPSVGVPAPTDTASANAGPEPSSVSIDDLPVVPPALGASAGAAPARPPGTAQRPVVAAPPHPTPTTGDRQRNFGF